MLCESKDLLEQVTFITLLETNQPVGGKKPTNRDDGRLDRTDVWSPDASPGAAIEFTEPDDRVP